MYYAHSYVCSLQLTYFTHFRWISYFTGTILNPKGIFVTTMGILLANSSDKPGPECPDSCRFVMKSAVIIADAWQWFFIIVAWWFNGCFLARLFSIWFHPSCDNKCVIPSPHGIPTGNPMVDEHIPCEHIPRSYHGTWIGLPDIPWYPGWYSQSLQNWCLGA